MKKLKSLLIQRAFYFLDRQEYHQLKEIFTLLGMLKGAE